MTSPVCASVSSPSWRKAGTARQIWHWGKVRAIQDHPDVTHLLVAWGDGDEAAFDRLAPLVYEELRRIARRFMAGERAGQTLQATALVNEAYMRLIDINKVQWQNRAQFFAMSARLMRRILVDVARSWAADRRRRT